MTRLAALAPPPGGGAGGAAGRWPRARGGVVGARVAGLLPLLGASYPVKFFASLDAACAWLERADVAQVADEMLRVADELHGIPRVVRGLRDYLEGALDGATIEGAA